MKNGIVNTTPEWIRKHWKDSLSQFSSSVLSHAIGYGFTDEDLNVLKELHRSGIHRKKIEDLLENCNFHNERKYWSAGLYGNENLLRIIYLGMGKVINMFLESHILFTEKAVYDFYGTRVSSEGIEAAKDKFDNYFTNYFFDTIDSLNTEALQDFVAQDEIEVSNVYAFIEKHKQEGVEAGMNAVQDILSAYTIGGSPLVNNLDGILTNYLLQSLTKYLEDNYFPQKFVIESRLRLAYRQFNQSSEIKEYYQKHCQENNSLDNFASWLKVNLTHKSLCDMHWAHTADYYKDQYYDALIDKFYASCDRSIVSTAIMHHPFEAARVYDGEISPKEFIDLFLSEE